MNRYTKFLAFFVVAFAFSMVGYRPAHAASITFIQFNRIGCENDGTGFRWNTDFPAPMEVRTIVSVGSSVYMDQVFLLGGTGPYNWGLFSDNTGGTVNASYPTPGGTAIQVQLLINGGPSLSFSYVCDGSVDPGRPIPAGFELRTIICTVAVFDAPNGNPVAGATIKNGQTWYINPESVKVTGNAKYPLWTEIYVSGTTNGYIPTACVGGAPAISN
jgi:hypothetical protein